MVALCCFLESGVDADAIGDCFLAGFFDWVFDFGGVYVFCVKGGYYNGLRRERILKGVGVLDVFDDSAVDVMGMLWEMRRVLDLAPKEPFGGDPAYLPTRRLDVRGSNG